jgi:uncharacterized protein
MNNLKSMHTSPLRLRGHHLICLHFFNGEGYNPGFIENLLYVLRHAETGEPITIVPGDDDVCNVCPFLKERRCFYRQDSDEDIRDMDRTAIGLLGLSSRPNTSWPEIRERLPAIFTTWYGKFCRGCDWLPVCRKNAAFSQLYNAHAESKF